MDALSLMDVSGNAPASNLLDMRGEETNATGEMKSFPATVKTSEDIKNEILFRCEFERVPSSVKHKRRSVVDCPEGPLSTSPNNP
eukprot:2044641-Rhodomonas_salina.1